MENTEKQENVIQEVKTEETPVNTSNEQQKQEEPKVQARIVEQEGGNFKIKLKKKDEPVQEQSTDEVPVRDKSDDSEKVSEENKQEEVEKSTEETKEEEVVLEEVKQEDTQQEEVVEEKIEEPVAQTQPEPQVVVPENLKDLVKFMEDTGGTLEDYARLNADYSNIDDNALLLEYYKTTKPHLNMEEVNFLIEDNFHFDEEIDEPRNIKKKKLAFKEEIVKARKHLTGLKDQYYKEVKLGSKLTSEQKEAVEFYNTYKQEQATNSEIQKQQLERFQKSTDSVFNNNFKGFDFNVGEKTYRYNIKDVQVVKEYQSDISNFVREFLNDKNMMQDAKGYHKALYAGKNIDKIVKHFYDQGKADAIKETSMNAKNIDMSPRTAAPVVDAGGRKFRVLSGDDSSSLKFKIRNK
tara:strand:+ start:4060 stop:5283 length:1224 start_codon:yes stop_codon:yes gene_type:complete